ncbi:class I SAM-dependent methyltransferase [Patulibacter defluvii]|uniref:class I SAM-dependent methyltransferase n=1 Tax=Patulibacter defluvii TaxID=3095358 RepID=UPI002A75D72A|nr:class I SAM-dependent methyltransferase [Patulibacter sp. DM4]
MSDDAILPASGRFLPVGVYDLGLALMMREGRWRPALTRAVLDELPLDGRAVEVGAGTGALTRRLAEAAAPGTSITAVEPDPNARAIGERRTPGTAVSWRSGRAEQLPLADASQDAVVLALVLHHLRPDAKRAALVEARRVLRPTGALLIADFGPPQDPLMAVAFASIELLDGPATTRSHRRDVVRRTIAEAGFAPPAMLVRLRTVAGTLELLRARPA